MKEIPPFVASAIPFSLSGHDVGPAGDVENIKKLSSLNSTGGTRGELMEQDTEFAANIRSNILPHTRMSTGTWITSSGGARVSKSMCSISTRPGCARARLSSLPGAAI